MVLLRTFPDNTCRLSSLPVTRALASLRLLPATSTYITSTRRWRGIHNVPMSSKNYHKNKADTHLTSDFPGQPGQPGITKVRPVCASTYRICFMTASNTGDDLRFKTQLEMWANAQRDGRHAEYRWRPLFNAAVWLTPTTRVPCSNDAKKRNPLKLPGVPQINETISAASGLSSPYCGDV